MTGNYDVNLIAKELRQISSDIDYAVAHDEKKDGYEIFVFFAIRKLTTDEMVSICRDMATVIRREMPERLNGWAASIHAAQYGALTMGYYSIGWAGHPDEWYLHEGQEWTAAYYAEFLALRDRLRAAVTMLGTEGDRVTRDGDFRLVNGEIGQYRQTVFVHRPEFLTTDLIRTIQNVLKDGSDEWVVDIGPSFGPPFVALWEGIEVRVDGVVEKWDRQEAEQLLGDRLKIPRYARDHG